MELFTRYINSLGYTGRLENTEFGTLFQYETELLSQILNKTIKIPFLFYKDVQSLFKFHLSEWNLNELDYFIAVGSDKSFIFKAKEKPDEDNPFKKEVLIDEQGFLYGINTVGYKDIDPLSLEISKENIDNSVYFDFVLRKQKEIKNEVDNHLLNNLIALKNELSKFDKNAENINGLILKCLFVKYLEDRNILSGSLFIDVLKRRIPAELENTFNKISIINGDILKKELNILPEHIEQLEYFFTHDYKTFIDTKQQSLFYPYRFDKIPIQLISNIYEEFLGATNKEEKKSKGIFYTRTFVVDFMLSHTIYPRLDKHPKATVLDPACGSGAFLVQAFKRILNNSEHIQLSIDEKANLLKSQIFGIDNDENALQISAFSLYLTLLEGIPEDAIKEQIERRNPILPSLIGSNLLNKNTITDDIIFETEIEVNGKKKRTIFLNFDCIVANPPWSQLKKSDAEKKVDIEKTRKAIETKEIYGNVHKYQTSQAFLLKINELCHEDTDIAIIVNNSNFLNEGAENFRKEVLEKYRIRFFYELSEIAPVLFKHTEHPCAILILDKQNAENNIIEYITPRLTKFNHKLRVISYSSKDVKEANQSDFKDEDVLWRIFINGNWKDYQLIKKIEQKKDEDIQIAFCSGGVIYDGATPIGQPVYKKKLEAKYLHQFYIDDDKLDNFNVNQKFERGREQNYDKLFTGKRILIKRQPTVSDNLRLVCSYTENDYIFGQQVMSAKPKNDEIIYPISGILNSSLIGYYFNQTASQSNRNKTISAIKVNEIKQLPLVKPSNEELNQIVKLINEFIERKKHDLKELDELILNLYGLLEFEKEIIREFYQINIERKNDKVKSDDIQAYADAFRESYQLVIKDELRLNTSFISSQNIGAVIKFDIVNTNDYHKEVFRGDFTEQKVLQLVKEKQIQKEMLKGYINEEKVKIYVDKSFYIIKSNQFKDWTKRQAIEDANEEARGLMKKLF